MTHRQPNRSVVTCGYMLRGLEWVCGGRVSQGGPMKGSKNRRKMKMRQLCSWLRLLLRSQTGSLPLRWMKCSFPGPKNENLVLCPNFCPRSSLSCITSLQLEHAKGCFWIAHWHFKKNKYNSFYNGNYIIALLRIPSAVMIACTGQCIVLIKCHI